MSNTQDLLATNTSKLLSLPLDSISEATINNELKICDKYDTAFTDMSTLISTYKHIPVTDASHTSPRFYDEDGGSDDDSSSDHRSKSTPQIKFAPIKLPTFSGDVTTGENNFSDWMNLFNVSVENIEDDAIKHIYLTQSLRGKALKLVANIPASTLGYNNALSILKKQFSNQKRMLHLTLKALVNYEYPNVKYNVAPSITYRENWSSLLTLVRSVQNSKKEGFTSEDLLSSLVQMKLNPNLSVEVERIISNKTESTTLEELFDIINGLIMSHEVSECTRTFSSKGTISTPAVDGATRSENFYNNNTVGYNAKRTPKCIFCGPSTNDHFSSRCTFEMTPNERREKVKEFRCCFNCLIPGNQPNSHNAVNCPSKHKKCRICSGAHHSLLCFKKKEDDYSATFQEPG